MSANKARGTAAETAVVNYLRTSNPHVERRALSGRNDRGDIAGILGVCIEVKSHASIDLAAFVDEAVTEGINADANVAVAWIKRRGRTNPADWYVAMTGAQFVQLLRDAKYLPTETQERPAGVVTVRIPTADERADYHERMGDRR